MNNWFSIELHEEGFEYTKEYNNNIENILKIVLKVSYNLKITA